MDKKIKSKQDKKLNPRKLASKTGAKETVKSILDAAALILEQNSFGNYTTNGIASRAGVSIGSLYQYFPNKDSITITLIERESASLVSCMEAIAQMSSFKEGIRLLIKAAVDYQMARPALAKRLDFEEARLVALNAPLENAAMAKSLLFKFFSRHVPESMPVAAIVGDVMAIMKALNDRAGFADDRDIEKLEAKILAAVSGYLSLYSLVAI
ncbi:TetR family transcriptional regulator [Undibacterium sp. TJN19]|uniref:TetR family transcriptional regulator n=1 Tax=Undibacterium sp. TJN19 TaxID=3413055 RepID=UPI003BEF7BCE